MSNLELLDRAAAATTCDILGVAGQELIGVGVWTLWAPKISAVAFTSGALSLLAANYLCPDQPMGGDPLTSKVEGCAEMSPGGYGQFEYKLEGGEWTPRTDSWIFENAVRIEPAPAATEDSSGIWSISCGVYSETDGTTATIGGFTSEASANAVVFRIDPIEGECQSAGEPGGYNPYPPSALQPIEYTDNVTNCTYNVTLQGFAEEAPGGTAQPVYLVEGVSPELRSDGGRMGGCNFPPTIYMPGGGGGGGTYLPTPSPLPVPDPDGVPWWAQALVGAAAGAALNQVLESIDDLLQPKLPEGSFTLTAPCDVDAEGNPLTETWTYPSQKVDERLLAHQITMLEAIQTQLDWKTPICGHEKPTLEGQWVTTRWESDEKMAHSGRRLRKLFRYRTKSTRDLGQLSSYWRSFTWTAGPVCVVHKGAWWGDPQVWASTQEEGRRVIRFAAAEAGIDPDQVGEWGTSSSRSPRYGMSGTMRIALFDDFPWVASRDGPSWPNLLAKSSDP